MFVMHTHAVMAVLIQTRLSAKSEFADSITVMADDWLQVRVITLSLRKRLFAI